MYYKIGLLRKVKAHIKSGGVIAYPTESCFGFGCDIKNYRAINKVIKIKSRNKDKGLIVIASKFRQLSKTIEPLTALEASYLKNYWPGFYSFVFSKIKTKAIPPNLIGKNKSIAIRLSNNLVIKQLCGYLNMPLVSTSVNKSGYKTVKTTRDCMRLFGHNVMVLGGGNFRYKKPSTIIYFSSKKVLR